jgi:hypothetical protein
MSKLYIRVRTNFYTHKKTLRLRRLIGNDAYWLPPRLWAYAAENQPDGDLSGYTSDELAELLGYSGHATSNAQCNASSMLKAMQDAGFVDPDLKIHDWQEHNGYHEKFAQRARNAANARWEKEKGAENLPQTPSEIEIGNRKGESGVSNAQAMLEASNPPAPAFAAFPTLTEVKAIASMRGVSPDSAARFFEYHNDNNLWLNKHGILINWQSKLVSWGTKDRVTIQQKKKKEINYVEDAV